jgi:hypothetical protein
MRNTIISRRALFETGAWALAAASGIPGIASARAQTGLSPQNDETVRQYYTGWEKKDWRAFDMLLTDDFTFSSPLDAHISKSAFKTGCWDTQISYIGRFDLEHMAGTGNEAFVMYLCHTTNDKTFRNVEYLRLKGRRVQAVECYFGGKNTFTSAVATGQS